MPTVMQASSMTNPSVLDRIPTELWSEIFSYFSRTSQPAQLGASSPLDDCDHLEWDKGTVIALSLTCRSFYDIVAPLLANSMHLGALSTLSIPGRLERSTFDPTI